MYSTHFFHLTLEFCRDFLLRTISFEAGLMTQLVRLFIGGNVHSLNFLMPGVAVVGGIAISSVFDLALVSIINGRLLACKSSLSCAVFENRKVFSTKRFDITALSLNVFRFRWKRMAVAANAADLKENGFEVSEEFGRIFLKNEREVS